jgi:NADH-quinone oxidoreductase subunit J
MLSVLFFYLFATVCIGAAFMVVAAKNPVHAVLFLILAFFNAAGLFVLLGAEFLAMILVVVYVGAVAVLFLFVVMMLDVDFVQLREGFLQYLPVGGLIGLILLIELLLILGGASITPDIADRALSPIPPLEQVTNTRALGEVIYTRYVYLFQAAGLLLLIAMIGAIVLTHRKREGVRRQSIADQVSRRREDSVELRKVRPGQGV